ncbi:MAG: diguanylate cyclase [Betaproteobacteria bacterium]|nr:diguanylate cyclase [Betaproteobacteria bacterium]
MSGIIASEARQERERRRQRSAALSAAQSVAIAKTALQLLSAKGLPPTPDNYAKAWAEASADRLLGGGGYASELTVIAAEEPDTPAVAEPPALQTESELTSTGPERTLPQAERLADELVRMVDVLCDVLASLTEDESWVNGQIEAVRRLLQGDIDRSAIADLRLLLADTAQRQKQVRDQRARTLAQLKQSLSEMAGVIAELSASTDTFANRMADHATSIEEAPSLEALGDMVRGLLEDTRTMQVSVETSREGLAKSSEAAASLEQELHRLEKQLAEASAEMLTDHLTRAMNRRGLEEAFQKAAIEADLNGQPLSVALIDVDDFKRLNDALGHKAGDEALRHLADLLRTRLRPTDIVARYGGEEFVLVLIGVNRDLAVSTVERLQRALTGHVFMHGESRTFITFSGGVTEVREGDSLNTALVRADEAMYRAKREGKNCVRAA